jgi:MscS family membrane protein
MIKKTILAIIIFFNIIIANSQTLNYSIWDNINQQKNNIQELINNENNNDVRIEKKIKLKEKFLNIISENPFLISEPKLNTIELKKLKERLKYNKSRYKNAAYRDTLKIKEIELDIEIKSYIFTLVQMITNHIDREEVENFIEERNKYFNSFQYNEKKYINKDKSSKIEKEIINNNNKLKIEIILVKDISNNIKENIFDLIYKETIMSFFEVNKILSYFNSIESFSKVNTYLLDFKLSVAKLLLILLLAISTLFFNKVFIYIVKNKLDKLIKRDKITESDEIRDNFQSTVIYSLKLFIYLFTINFIIELIIYPNELSETLNDLTYLIHIGTFGFLLNNLIDFIVLYVLERNHYLKDKKKIRSELVNFSIKIFKVIILVILLFLYLKYINVDITAIIASLGIGGLAIALAAKETLSNFFGSINILMDNSFSQGDWIKTSLVEGTVVELGMRSTTIRTFDNALITVSNSKLANDKIINWSKRLIGRRIKFKLGLTYNSKREDVKKVIADIENLLKNHSGIATEKTNFNSNKKSNRLIKKEDLYGVKKTLLVYLDSYNDSSIDILVYCFTRTTDWIEWLEVKEDVLFNIWEIVEKNNCDFAFPTQTIYYEKNKE